MADVQVCFGPGIEDDTDMVVSPILPLGVHPI